MSSLKELKICVFFSFCPSETKKYLCGVKGLEPHKGPLLDQRMHAYKNGL